MSSRGRKLLRGLAFGLVGTFLVVLNLVAGALLYLTTDGARERLVALAVRKLEPVFPGGFEIGSSSGSLPHGFVLRDVLIRDLDERPAIELDRIELAYSLLPLFIARVQVDKLLVDGLTVISQPLHDGRDNLATLALLEKPLPPPPSALPVSIRLSQVEADARFVIVPAGTSIDDAPRDTDVRSALRLAATLSRGMVATLDAFQLDVVSPALATVTASGGVHITKDAADLELRDVLVRVDGDTTQLHRHIEQLELIGPARILARADGPMRDLRASLVASTTKPPIHLVAAAHVFGDRAQLEMFELDSPFATATAEGTYRFDQTGDAVLHVDARDLRPLSLLGAPPMSGSVKLDGVASRDRDHLKVRLKGAIEKLRVGQSRVEHASVDVDIADRSGKARLDAKAIVLGSVNLRTAGLRLDASPTLAKLTATARGAEGLELDLSAAGVPHVVKDRLLGLDATLERLRLRTGGTPWELAAPAHLSADFPAKAFALDKLELDAGRQHLQLMGRVRGESITSASVTLQHFDLSQLAGLLSPGHALPHSDFAAKLAASGPFEQPNVNATFAGTADGKGKSDLIHATATGEAQLGAGRLNAKVFATIGGQKTSAKVDMPLPLRPQQPIDVSFDAKVLLNPWFADLLVPKLIQSQPVLLYSLGTTVLVQGDVSGTTSDPRVHVGARLRNWGAANGHGQLGASLEYAKKKLSTSATLTFSALPAGGGAGGGVVRATAVMPIDLAPTLSGQEGRLLDPTASWHAELKLEHVGLEHVPFAAFAIVPITGHGWIDGSLELAGTQRHPKGTAKLDARGLNVSGLADVDLIGSAELDDRVATARLKASVHGGEALRVEGSIGSVERAFDWWTAPLAFTFASDGFDLGRLNLLKNLDGRLQGHVELTGTLRRPSVKGTVHAGQLRLGSVTYSEVSLRGGGSATHGSIDVTAAEVGGGRLTLSAAVNGRKLTGSLALAAFHFDLESELFPRLRAVSAQLDGALRLAGSSQAPELNGAVEISRGELKLLDSPTAYHDARASLRFSGQEIALSSAKVQAGGDGELEANGTLGFRRCRIARLSVTTKLHRLPLQWDTITARVDATAVLDGSRATSGVFQTRARLSSAFLELLDDRTKKGLISTAHLDDVKIEKARPSRFAMPLAAAPDARAAHKPTIEISGPATVRSSGVDLNARAELKVDFATQVPLLEGRVTLTPMSKLMLFGQPVDVERGQFEFHRSALPTLDFSLSREVRGGRVGVDLAGPARQPTLRFWARPQHLDAVQIAALLTGQAVRKGGLVMKGLREKADGPISDLIATALSQRAPKLPVAKLDPAPASPPSR